MQDVARDGPARRRCAPSGPSWRILQLQTGNTAMFAFVLAVVLVFLVLAAQYESWSLPLAVILVVPMCLLCSCVGVNMAQMDINIFTQVGFIVLVGLACKNAILIVEFAKAQHEAGSSRKEATLEACQLRLRPIMMTSLAFILGVVPLMVSEGAGAEMRQDAGHGGLQRHARRHPVRDLLDAGLLLRDPVVQRSARSDRDPTEAPKTRSDDDHADGEPERRPWRLWPRTAITPKSNGNGVVHAATRMPAIDGGPDRAVDRAGAAAAPADRTRLHVVLVEPEIALNTGSIGRTCVAAGAMLWLVRPLGFHLDDRHLRRAGLDYWEHLNWQVVDRLDEVVAALGARPASGRSAPRRAGSIPMRATGRETP